MRLWFWSEFYGLFDMFMYRFKFWAPISLRFYRWQMRKEIQKRVDRIRYS